MKCRQGLVEDVDRMFKLAEEMCGFLHPDLIDGERKRVRALRIETIRLLRSIK